MKKKKIIYSAEKAKLDHKQRYTISGTSSSRVIDELAAYTARVFNSKVAVINFVDQHDVWPKKGVPLDRFSGVYTETNVCSLAYINDIEDYIEVSFDNFIEIPALVSNPMVAAEYGMKFYAAVPILNDQNVQIGTVCILDRTRKELLPEELDKLNWIAGMVKKHVSKRESKNLCA